MITNKQEMFTTAWNGLKAQGFTRSGYFDDDKDAFICLYREPMSEKRCAFGHCIPDEEMQEDFEGDVAPVVLRKLGVPDEDNLYEFVTRLQAAHDMSSTPEEMKKGFGLIAERYSLKLPESLEEQT